MCLLNPAENEILYLRSEKVRLGNEQKGRALMTNLTDYIEEHIKRMLALSPDKCIEIKRRELAGKFSCVPSQINYVLKRRFSLDRGYLVESRRGGSGCIRIYRINSDQAKNWRELIASAGGEEFESARVRQLLIRMIDEKLISRREASVLETIIREETYTGCGLDREQAGKLQRRLLGNALEELLKAGY